jgi:hypothetical protein
MNDEITLQDFRQWYSRRERLDPGKAKAIADQLKDPRSEATLLIWLSNPDLSNPPPQLGHLRLPDEQVPQEFETATAWEDPHGRGTRDVADRGNPDEIERGKAQGFTAPPSPSDVPTHRPSGRRYRWLAIAVTASLLVAAVGAAAFYAFLVGVGKGTDVPIQAAPPVEPPTPNRDSDQEVEPPGKRPPYGESEKYQVAPRRMEKIEKKRSRRAEGKESEPPPKDADRNPDAPR